MIDKSAAIRMRLAGHKYEHIAKTLHCSLSWCKKNLSGVCSTDIDSVPDKNELCNQILMLVEELRKL